MLKKVIIAIAVIILSCVTATSCSKYPIAETKFASLFSTTNYFVDMLDSVYEHYDALSKKAKYSSDGKYTVTPMGRLIVVKKKLSAVSVTYSEIASALTTHYKSNSKVNKCFENNNGTVTIDCRK